LIEERLGFALPPLLRDLYTGVADGGFGPGYGILPAGELPDVYGVCRSYADGEPWRWPDQLVPFCYWGCEVYECIDCADSRGRVIHFDADLGGPSGDNFDETFPSLELWLEDWLAGNRA
jgi:hypothetical protein